MKEIIRPTLTNPSQTPYPKSGDIFMEIPKQRENPQGNSESNIPPEKIESARKDWATYRGPLEQLRYEERQVIEQAIKKGRGPLSEEEIAEISKKYGGSEANMWGSWGEELRRATMEDIINKRTEKEENSGRTAGSSGGGGRKPPDKPPTSSDNESSEENPENEYIDETKIESNVLKAHVKELNEFIGKVAKTRNTKGWAELRKKLGEIEYPKGLTREQRVRFDLDKARLLGTMAEAIRELSPQRAELEQKYSELEIAIRAGDYDGIDKVINDLDIDDYTMYSPVIRQAIDRIEGHDHMLEYLLEYGVERILSIADVNPKVQYPNFNLYQTQNLDSVTQAARLYDERRGDKTSRVFKYLTDLRSKRYAMHELARSMKSREDYVKLVTQLLRQDGLAFVERDIAGVSDVQIAYEKVLSSRLSLKKGSLKNEDYNEADREVKLSLDASIDSGMGIFKKTFLKNGEPDSRELRPWEIKRAWLVGKSLHSATQRRLLFALLGNLAEGDVDQLLKSVESEFIARILAPMKLFPERFFSWPIGKAFLKHYIEFQKELQKRKNRRYGYLEENKEGEVEEKGLYGKKANNFAVLDTGVQDPKSNSWRGRLLFLRQKEYSTETMPDGTKGPIGEYLRLTKEENKSRIKVLQRTAILAAHPKLVGNKEALEKLLEKAEYKRPREQQLKSDYNAQVKDVIANQRLFLGVILHNFADLNEDNRMQIWKNAAKFMPSQIAAFFPEELKNIVGDQYGLTKHKVKDKEEYYYDEAEFLNRWNQIKSKLFLAEMARVRGDAEYLQGKREKPTEISDYFEQLKIDSSERVVIEAMRKLGELKARDLAKIKFPFTPFLDDVPKASWENLEDEDFDRILINDQSQFEQGWAKLIGLIAKQEQKPEDVVKIIAEGWEHIASPMGQPDARVKVEPVILAYLGMSRMKKTARFFNSVMGLLRIPRSEAEEHNLQANNAQDEREQRSIFRGLAQAGVISDDPEDISDDPEEGSGEKIEHGQTQLLRMEKRSDADLKALILHYFRIIVMIFGLEFAKSFMKGLLPEDLSKSLG